MEERHVDRRETEHRSDGYIETPDEYDKGHSHRHDRNNGDIADDCLEVCIGKEVGCDSPEEHHENDEQHEQSGHHALAVYEHLGKFFLEGSSPFPFHRHCAIRHRIPFSLI